MAAVSQTATTFTPPANSHDTGYSWELSVSGETEKAFHDAKRFVNDEHGYPPPHQTAQPSQNGNSTHTNATGIDSDMKIRNFEPPYVSQHIKDSKPRSVKSHHANSVDGPDAFGAAKVDRNEDTRRGGPRDDSPDSQADDNSKWIHRDKLARIENEELQAAGIYLPRQRDRARSKSQNRPRRDQSQDKLNGSGRSIGGTDHGASRSRKNSGATTTEPKTPDLNAIPAWDLRRPEEIVEEGDGYWTSTTSGKTMSRIPVAKVSPVPIPSEHIERDTLLARKRDGSPGGEDSISYPRTRARSGTGNTLPKPTTSDGNNPQSFGHGSKPANPSPKKPAGTRKPKVANGAPGRPKTRGGPSKDSTSSGAGNTRPSTRSGERELSASSKPMEGEPPWMVSAYRPDPRLPPEQQLLPTVARRLAQEKWEKEGKFGNIYDKEFRPLTDEGFLMPPDSGGHPDSQNEKDAQQDEQADWPLKSGMKSPSLNGRSNSYSTMPRISDKQTMSPLPSPRTPGPPPQQQQQQPQPQQHERKESQPPATVRVPEPPPEDPPQKKDGCGCCIVM
ncbi:hypothetical protein QBC35DRAFT_166808 [Podospora australis]|uniref:TeaA receptor TeaR n=1 Tax=Podospora australis TaxID=1536484 RepID=A0AAN6WVT8_9PEZI|nr:hypothetical protein QBC35DRAFT_166808 [Podospora australis]